jgi:hypothetical protein
MAGFLHIISFDVPYPADYGGVVDVFYKLRALHREGVKIILHCYEYGRGNPPELHKYCERIHYYPRNLGIFRSLSSLPYIVNSRNGSELLNRLQEDKYPILFEGLHSCYYLQHPALEDRVKIVRTHNVEHHYYKALADSVNGLFKKGYFLLEASRLKSFEAVLSSASGIAAISMGDAAHFSSLHNRVHCIPAFHPFEKVVLSKRTGDYALYHGNLGVPENDRAAKYLVSEVMPHTKCQLIIAGSNPSAELIRLASRDPRISLRAGIDTQTLHLLVAEAAVNILPTFQATGIKLKLLAALFTGKHCIVNTPMVKATGLEDLCLIADDAIEMAHALDNCIKQEFSQEALAKRQIILEEKFSNRAGALNLMKLAGIRLGETLLTDI